MRNVYAATALIALTLVWLGFSGLRAYQSTCDRARAVLRQSGGRLEDALKYGDSAEIRRALARVRFDSISSISFWGVNLLDQQTTSAVTVGDGNDPVVCELPLGQLGSVAFQMRPIQFVQSVVSSQLWTVLGLWMIALLAFLIPLGETAQPAPAADSIACDAFSSMSQVLESKRALNGRKIQLLLLRPPGEQTIRLSRRDFQNKIAYLIDKSVEFGANSLCFDARVHGRQLRIKVIDNHAQETVLTLPI